MKNLSVVMLVISGLVLAGFAEAAAPKKRTRNANRVGAYAGGNIGMTTYTGDQSGNEAGLLSLLTNGGYPSQNLSSNTEDTDIGYEGTFGFRFNRYFALEFGFAQYGEVVSTAKGELDVGNGFVPADTSFSFSAGGPVIAVLGIFPINDKVEIFGRAGYLFASAEVELASYLDGERVGYGSGRGESNGLVLGLGGSWNFNQVYSLRAEYQKIDSVGQSDRTGKEDLTIIALGLIVRF